MRVKIREILEECIELGIEHGIKVAHKYVDEPPHDLIAGSIDNSIWFEIDQRFDFERNVCDEVVEGFDQLEKEREWLDLTYGEMRHIADKFQKESSNRVFSVTDYGCAVQAKLKEKNT